MFSSSQILTMVEMVTRQVIIIYYSILFTHFTHILLLYKTGNIFVQNKTPGTIYSAFLTFSSVPCCNFFFIFKIFSRLLLYASFDLSLRFLDSFCSRSPCFSHNFGSVKPITKPTYTDEIRSSRFITCSTMVETVTRQVMLIFSHYLYHIRTIFLMLLVS